MINSYSDFIGYYELLEDFEFVSHSEMSLELVLYHTVNMIVIAHGLNILQFPNEMYYFIHDSTCEMMLSSTERKPLRV